MAEQRNKHLLSERERLILLNNIYIAHPQSQEILKKMQRAHRSKDISPEPKSMSIIGPTGSGKSTVIKKYMEQHPPSIKAKSSQLTIFNAVIPSDSTPRKFIRSLLTALLAQISNCKPQDVPVNLVNDQDSDTTKLRFYKYLQDSGVELIILDEFQHLISNKTDSSNKVLLELAKTIKVMIIETGIPIIMVGTGRASIVFDVDPEVSRRFHASVEMRPFMISDDDNFKTFRKFLAEVDKLMPFETLSKLADKELAIRLYAASNGFIDDIMRIIHAAGEEAIEEQASCISLEYLAEAFENAPGKNQTAEGNPFRTPINKVMSWRCIQDAYKGIVTSSDTQGPQKVRRKSTQLLKDIF
ncbi:TniB family NTP-binding protein [uncultured Methylophaga sp.]|jgi:energy-coupling factor transporter ATP-binding protein EcfA2|uniref:TniB family NTP-binding protein n=1 Tax=uncultured Methylophaga sp. TaxID=285271 RepID=UPI002624A812|nr:TniB family NTP-binding protein [uncultured Methylophaga sp.]